MKEQQPTTQADESEPGRSPDHRSSHAGRSVTAERLQRLESLFARGVGLDDTARAALLEQVGRDHPALRDTLEALLRADAGGDETLRDAVEQAAAAVVHEAANAWCGRQLGAYRIERQLAAGGMGTVFLASRADDEFERRAAVKLLSSALLSQDARRRFLVERQILADLAHPYIAQLLDGGTTDDGVPYLVMEYVDGLPIDAWCEGEGLPVHERLRLFRKVCEAVQYAHRHLVVHRDIKPGNILVTAGGTPKLLDFGIAKLLDTAAASVVTVAEARLLTPLHASPEQVRGKPVTTASDVYSLGVLLYRLLTGSSPYRASTRTPREIEEAICETDPVRPSAAANLPPRRMKELSGDLDNILLKALRKEPEERYASVEELSGDIERYLGNRPVFARPASLRYRTRKFLARRAREVAAGAAVFLLVASLVVYYTVQLAAERDLQAQQRATAEQVSDFMVGLFTKADPWSGEADVTARELLERGVEHIDELREAQPLVAASLMLPMGRAHEGLGNYDAAAGLASEALDIRRARLPAGHPDIAEALHILGDSEASRSRYAEARALLLEALAMRERALGPEALEVGQTLYRLAQVYDRLGELEAMREAAERSLAIHEQALGPDHEDTGDVVGLLGAYYSRTGDYETAREYVARSLGILEAAFGRDSIQTLARVHSLGLISWQLGEYERAYDIYRRELVITETNLGPDHPVMGYALYGLAITSKNLGNYGEAFDWFARTITLQEAVLGPDDDDLATTLGGYGFVLLEAGRFDQARTVLERSLAIFERKFGPLHLDLRAPLAGLAKVAIAQGRYADADALLGRTRGIVESQLAPDHANVLRTLISSGELYVATGDYERAREYFARGLEGLERTIGLEHPYAVPALAGMAAVQTAAGEYEDAERNFERAIAIHDRLGDGDRSPELAAVLKQYADLLRMTSRENEAADMSARARRIREAVAASITRPAQ